MDGYQYFVSGANRWVAYWQLFSMTEITWVADDASLISFDFSIEPLSSFTSAILTATSRFVIMSHWQDVDVSTCLQS